MARGGSEDHKRHFVLVRHVGPAAGCHVYASEGLTTDDRLEPLLDLHLDTVGRHSGGSITGEHGVGVDKAKYMPRMYSEDDLDTMQLVRCAFDPAGISNPGKLFPTPRLCGEVPARHKGAHPLQEAGVAEVF